MNKIHKGLTRISSRCLSWDLMSLSKINKQDKLVEIGTKYGGWIIPSNLLNRDSVIYCAGCGEDISFDLGLIDRYSCKVHGFDPTPRAIKHVREQINGDSRYVFSEVGLWDREDRLRFYTPKDPAHVSHSLLNLQKTEEYIEVAVKPLSQIMSEFGHKRIDVLKIDIEGAEYKVIQSIIDDNLDIGLICVEFDEYYHPIDGRYMYRIRSSVNGLLGMGYDLVCAQGNGNYTFMKVHN